MRGSPLKLFYPAFHHWGRNLTRTVAIAAKELEPGNEDGNGRSVKDCKRMPC